MVTYDELIKLAKMSEKSLGLTEEQLVSFVKNGAVRAYKAGMDKRKDEDVLAEFNAETKQLRLMLKKKESGGTAQIEITDADTYRAIDTALAGMQKLLVSEWKKANALLVKTKFQEFKATCLLARVTGIEGSQVTVTINNIEAHLLQEEQVASEQYAAGQELAVYVKSLKEECGGCDMIVSRKDPALVSYAVRRHIPEVDVGNIEVKAVARIAGKRSRVAVWSKDFGPAERCTKRQDKVSNELGGESVDFVEWYPEIKAFIASAVKAEARDVHVIESEKQALIEVFKDSAEQALNPQEEVIKLAQELTGYRIEVKLVSRDESTELPGV